MCDKRKCLFSSNEPKRSEIGSTLNKEEEPQRQSMEIRRSRILGRRYSLTQDFSKYVEIGILTGSGDSCTVDLAIGDSRGHEIRMTRDLWNTVICNKSILMEMFTVPSEMIELCGESDMVAFRTVKLNKSNIETMEIFDTKTSIFLTANTLSKLFDLEYCMDHMYSWLEENVPAVKQKFTKFVEILRGTATSNYKAAIMEDPAFERHSLIDCELLALCMKPILGEVMMGRSMNGGDGQKWKEEEDMFRK